MQHNTRRSQAALLMQVSKWDSAAVINGLLTGELPASVVQLDRNAQANPLHEDGAGTQHASSDGQRSEGLAFAQGLSWGQAQQGHPELLAQPLARQPPAAPTRSSKYAGAQPL